MNTRVRRFGWLLALFGLGGLALWLARSPSRSTPPTLAVDTREAEAAAMNLSLDRTPAPRDGISLPAVPTSPEDEGTAEEPIRLPIAATVVPRRALRGYVLDREQPVAGARLTLGATHAPTILRDEQGVAPLDRSSGSTLGHTPPDGTTDAQGAFVLEFQEELWWALQVEADGFPLTVFGPFPRARVDDPTDLVLELDLGGAIEGHVRTEGGAEPRELAVVAADRWGFVWTTPVEADGAYRIEALAPGFYRVQLGEGQVASKSPEFWSSTEMPLSSDCIVRAGATTHLDLPQEDSVVLAGELTLLGGRREGREALLLPLDAPIGSRDGVRARAYLDAQGHFELRLARPDMYRLEVRSESLLLSEVVDLCARRPEWRRRWETGRLHVRVRAAARSAGHAHSLLRYLAEDLGSTRCVSTYVDSFWTEEFVLDVPAGHGRLEVLSDGASESEWLLLRDLSVPAGREIAVDYP